MAKDNMELATKIEASTGKGSLLAFQSKINGWFGENLPKLAAMAGSQEEARKMFAIALGVINRNPAILECSYSSITQCLATSMSLKLYPGPFQECAYVPLKNSKKGGVKEANFWPMYQGIVKLMKNAGNRCIVARVVFEGDFFEYAEGLEAPKYKPAIILGIERGAPLFAYAAVLTREGAWQVEVMSPEQIEVVKNRSPASRSPESPWNSKFDDDVMAMWAKTVLKRVAKWCTKSDELVQAIDADNAIEQPEFQKPQAFDFSVDAETEGVLTQSEDSPQPKMETINGKEERN